MVPPNPLPASLNLVVLDVETTGLNPFAGDRVCEVGVVQASGEQIIGTFQTLVNPERPISPGAARVNGLSDAQVVQAPVFAEIAPQVFALLDGSLLLCHNATFDLDFIDSEFARLDLTFRPAGVIDTLVLARRFFHFPTNNLSSLAARFGVKTPDAHRALGDALTTLFVFHALLNLLDAQGKSPDLSWVQPHHSTPKSQLEVDLPPTIQDALCSNTSLEIIYIDALGVETTRTISPRRVRVENGGVYLVAFCHLRQAERSFRLDRIAAFGKAESASSDE